ncbi:unnamed protein product [Brassica rapa subsp. trilocularis]
MFRLTKETLSRSTIGVGYDLQALLQSISVAVLSIRGKKKTIGEDPLPERRKIKEKEETEEDKYEMMHNMCCLKLGSMLIVVPNPYQTTSSPSVR